MSDEFKLPRGGTLDIDLRRKRRRRPAPRAPTEDEQGIIPLDDEGTRYVRRGAPSITFYDLGTRLRSVPPGTSFNGARFRPAAATDTPAPDDAQDFYNEYVELEWEAEMAVASHPDRGGVMDSQDAPPLAVFQALDLALLGARAPDSTDPLDPLGRSPANGSGRTLTHCQPLSYDLVQLPLRVRAGATVYQIGKRQPDDAGHAWKKRKPAAADGEERWTL